VLSLRELESRHEIRVETYIKKLQIEARVLGDLAINHVVPTALLYQNLLIDNVRGLKELFPPSEYDILAETQLQSIRKISDHIRNIRQMTKALVERRKEVNKIVDIVERASIYSKEINNMMEEVRYHIDKLELIVDDKQWPLPKYRELLFLH